VPTFVIGDVHGCLEPLRALLQRLSLLDDNFSWSGGTAHLWLLGDYTDRGPDGVGVIDLLMRLQHEASQTGGLVGALLGNHDLILQEVLRFGNRESPGWKRQGRSLGFRDMWLENAGGRVEDLTRLQPQHLEWLTNLPALAKVGDTLLMHADSMFYLEYGSSVQEVNANLRQLLLEANLERVDTFEERFARRGEFLPLHIGEDVALENLELVLNTFGARRLVHGHTPIYRLLEREAATVTEPWVYQGGRCINVDGCLYAGGPGFALSLETTPI
jgi:Calcineurin-like phosphoesterase